VVLIGGGALRYYFIRYTLPRREVIFQRHNLSKSAIKTPSLCGIAVFLVDGCIRYYRK
jgi:hypothetical protein